MQTVKDRVAFVTGGASGIGLGIARALAERGARIAIVDLRADHLEQARATAESEGWSGRCLALTLDVTDRPAVADALAQTQSRLGPLSILVNNAGVGIAGPITEATFPDWDWGIGVNLGGVVNGLVVGLPLIRAHGRGGHVVNTASLGALMPARPTRGIYAATKAAIVALSEHLRLDLRGSGIGVSVLLPGPTRTHIADSERSRPAQLRTGSRFVELEEQHERGERAAPPPPPADLPWLDPLEAGRMTVEAILGDRFYIVTHPQYLDAVKARHAEIERAIAEQRDRRTGNG
ncbi:MAG: SDR family NAD(P)-dependent oxidoreductase [Steroidobacteraceae bacterium]